MEYNIWCDESIKRGRLYSNFYGGVLVSSRDVQEIVEHLTVKKQELNFHGEVKWVKVTENYERKYIELLSSFFSFVREGRVKVRIMFTDNALVPVGLTKEQREDEFFLLYYQFIKNAFGLLSVDHEPGTRLRIHFDKIPDKAEKAARFKAFIAGLGNYFNARNVVFGGDGISEVHSHDHVLLQCLDIVLGAMAFRLNKLHLEKPPGSRFRGRKTRAKERVYKHINGEIQQIYPNFNIGVSTGMEHGIADAWDLPYRHWRFKSRGAVYDASRKN